MDTETNTVTTAVTVGDILDRYERDCLPELAESTQGDYVRHLGVLRDKFGSAVASELRPRDFGPFLDVKRGKSLRCKQLAVLSSAFTQAVSFWYVLDRNVLRDVKRPKFRPRDRLILQHEFDAVSCLATLPVRLAMRLALITGQRQGDILSFRWADIEELAEPIFDERTQEWCTMELNVVQSKTGKRIGIVIPKELEALLDECYQLPGGGKDGSDFVLPNHYGYRYTGPGFRACWQVAMAKYCRGGGIRFTFHDIRALCATRCPTLEYASKLLGHANTAMTRRVYRRGKERVVALASRSMGKAQNELPTLQNSGRQAI